MSDCHPEVPPETTPPCHPAEEPKAAPRRRDGGWYEFGLVALVLAVVLAGASVAAYAVRPAAVAPVEVAPGATIYYNEACMDCAMYLDGDLMPTLESLGIAPIVVKDYINVPAYREELTGLNDRLGIPFPLQSHIATFVGGANVTVLEGHVPGALIRESQTLAGRTERLLVHQDSMGTAVSYHAWAFSGDPKEYPIDTSLSVYVSWYAGNGGGGTSAPPAILPIVVGAALVDGLNPCAFAVLLFFVSLLYVSRRPRIELLRIGGLYIFAVFLAYFLIGLGLLEAIIFSTEDPHLIARVAGVLVVGLGVFTLVQPYLPGIPNPFHTPKFAWVRIRAWMLKGTQPAAAVAGFLVGLCTFPCSGGPYVATLGLLAARTSYWEGLGYLYLYNLAFVLPLVLILAVVSNKQLARATTKWERGHTTLIRQIAGLSMVVVGLLTVALA